MEWLVIGISGVTCGGKTTLAHSLLEYLQSHHNLSLWPKPYKVGMVRMLSQDNYFLPVEDERHRWLQQINAINFELLTSLDMKQMLNDISWIMCGNIMNNDQQQLQQQQQQQQQQPNEYHLMLHNQQQQQPQQMYHQSQQQQQTSTYYKNNNNKAKNLKHNNNNNKSSLQLQQQQQQHKVFQQQIEQQQQQHNDKIINILIIEGFIIFNQPDLYQLCNIKYHFHLPYEKCYERRQKRTYDPPDVTGYFELCVWPYYEKSLAEYRYHKDIIYLNGEIDRERIFKYVLKQISAYFNESQNTSDLVAVVDSTKTTTTPATATRNVKQLETIVNLNLRMLRHQQQPLVLQQHMLQMQQHKPQQQQQHEQYQRYQQHQQQLSSSQQQQQQQQQQQMCATGMQQ